MGAFEIEEQDSGTYLVYQKKETDIVDNMVLGMLENNRIEGTVPFSKAQVNSQISYQYDISGLISVAEYFGTVVSKQMLFSVIEGILSAREALAEYMLEISDVDLDTRHIYIQPKTENVKLLLLPIKHDQIPLEQFFKMLIFSAQYNPAEDCSYIASLLSYFNSEAGFSVVSFSKLIETLKRQSSHQQPQPAVQPVYQQPQSTVQTAHQQPQSAVQPVYQQPQPAAQPVYQQTKPEAQPFYQQPQSAIQSPCQQPQTPAHSAYRQPTAQSVYQQPAMQPGYQDTSPEKQSAYAKPSVYSPSVSPNFASQPQDAGTTVLNQAAASVNGGQKFVNPNLQRERQNQGQKYTNPNLSGGSAPRTYPGTGAMNSSSELQKTEISAPTPLESTKEKKGLFGKKDKPEKEKKGLFGKKEKPAKAISQKPDAPARKPVSFKGMAIPGSDVVQPTVDNAKTSMSGAIPAQNVDLKVHAAPIQNFGETVDLQSYTQETSVLEGGQVGICPCLIRKSTREQFFLAKEVTRIGRSRESVDIYITDNTSIGRVHAVLYWRSGKVFIEDQNSTNGTFVNDRRITGQTELIPGCKIRLSNEEFEFCLS